MEKEQVRLVEAAGVEPASGRVLREETTCLVRSKVSTDPSEQTLPNRSSPIVFQPFYSGQKLGANPAR